VNHLDQLVSKDEVWSRVQIIADHEMLNVEDHSFRLPNNTPTPIPLVVGHVVTHPGLLHKVERGRSHAGIVCELENFGGHVYGAATCSLVWYAWKSEGVLGVAVLEIPRELIESLRTLGLLDLPPRLRLGRIKIAHVKIRESGFAQIIVTVKASGGGSV
jgi:hypothetical protein